MPIYEYRCEDCEQIFEEWQKNFEEKQAKCPVCGANADRIISNTSFILKGSGWYVTDYCNRNSSSSGNGSSAASSNSNGSSDKSGSETKSSSSDSKPAASKATSSSSDSAKA